MERGTGRLRFRIGEVFPVGNPIAEFLVALSITLNELVTVSKWIAGGDHEQPGQRLVNDDEQLYLLRLGVAQLYELGETIRHARRDPRVEAFLDSLPTTARSDLENLIDANVREDTWVRATLRHVRNQTSHYGGRWNWDDLTWAMQQVAEDEGEIEVISPRLAGLRLRFADHVVNQHLTRRFPEHEADPHAPVDEETMKDRLTTLLQTVASATVAAQNFALAAMNVYLDTVADEAIRVER